MCVKEARVSTYWESSTKNRKYCLLEPEIIEKFALLYSDLLTLRSSCFFYFSGVRKRESMRYFIFFLILCKLLVHSSEVVTEIQPHIGAWCPII